MAENATEENNEMDSLRKAKRKEGENTMHQSWSMPPYENCL